jgi:hypothetical protein
MRASRFALLSVATAMASFLLRSLFRRRNNGGQTGYRPDLGPLRPSQRPVSTGVQASTEKPEARLEAVTPGSADRVVEASAKKAAKKAAKKTAKKAAQKSTKRAPAGTAAKSPAKKAAKKATKKSVDRRRPSR